MKCPKCGYNSFDYLDSCKKCGKDLIEHKQKFGIVSVLFPGQMSPVAKSATAEGENIAAAAVAAATATVAAGAAAAVGVEAAAVAEEQAVPDSAGGGDDFGFDFMGDSEEEEDLSFDELFEEASAEEDVEETLPSPEEAGDEFSFDSAAAEGGDENAAGESELVDDFGFDPDAADDSIETAAGPAEDMAVDDFELPPADEDDFSFDTDNVEFDESDEKEEAAEGAKEDPKDPFDLPESSQREEAPETNSTFFTVDPEVDSAALEEEELLFASEDAAVELPVGESNEDSLGDVFVSPPESVAPDFQQPEILPFSALESGAIAEPTLPAEVEDVTSVPTSVAFVSPEESVAADREPLQDEPQANFAAEFDSGLETEGFSAGLPAEDIATEDSVVEESFALPDDANLPATGSRVAAFCCDLALLLVVGTSFVIAAEAAISTAGASLLPSLETLLDLSIPYFLVLFSLAFGYFTLFHFLAGQTPGKMLAGLRVETVAGEPLMFSQAFLRSVGGLLQLLPIGLGYLAILASPDKRGWNDRLAGTRLISLKGLAEEG